MFGIEQSTLVGVSLIVAGFLLGNIQWIYLHKWLQNRAIRRVRRELSNNMPITIEQLDAGEHIIAVRVSDDVGNTTYKTFEVTVAGG